MATAYAIARDFADSPSEFWSGSAGAVYPMIRRLTERGLLESITGADGKRAKTQYRLTAEGRAAMEAWLLDAERAAGFGFDPLRTRMMFLSLVPGHRRDAFLERVEEHIKSKQAKNGFPGKDDPERNHVTRLRARISWIATLRRKPD
ncbi:MAG: PadR family transcriptional regulator [Parvularculaceae bacterium]|nr:PadR family transcriptional regulator [Parvularculaceae bacterium]